MDYLSALREFSKTAVGLHCPKCNQVNLYINGSSCSECEEEYTQDIDSEKLRFALYALDRFVKYENDISNGCANLIKMFNLSSAPIKNILNNNVLRDLKTIITTNNLVLGNKSGNVKVVNGTAELLIFKDKSTADTIKSLACLSTAIQFILNYPLNRLDIVENPYLKVSSVEKNEGLLAKLKKWFN